MGHGIPSHDTFSALFGLEGQSEAASADAERLYRTPTPQAALAVTEEVSHGRLERRAARVVRAPGLGRKHGFAGRAAIGDVKRTRVIDGKRQEECFLYVLSRPMSANDPLAVIAVTGMLGCREWPAPATRRVFREDDCRTRKDHGPENLALLRRFCLNSFRADSKKDTMRGKMMRAGWNDAYLFQLMTQMR
ncbi:hypothetical protein [Mesorhizobium sp. M0029]|uniref:hypothetical protein n=1 Tax=Mesorhizobium sp. M0029 TaxID=2956850 RepID=UPI00333D7DEB